MAPRKKRKVPSHTDSEFLFDTYEEAGGEYEDEDFEDYDDDDYEEDEEDEEDDEDDIDYAWGDEDEELN